MASQGSATPGGFWELDEPLPTRSNRAARTAAVAATWAVSALPLLVGRQRCPVALFLHRPCPGCGMTRAIRLLASGHVDASLRMHPLALPVLVVGSLFALATIAATFTTGSPIRVQRTRFGRSVIVLGAVVYAATFALWLLRALGYLGGPVPV